MVILEIDL